MIKLVLVRHGESTWNMENRFTGWADPDLSMKGIEESSKAGKLLKKEGYSFDLAFTSVLKRAIRTLWIVLDNMDLMWIPVENSWRLNERHYGALQGLNKAEMAAKYGEKQVLLWRRGYDVRPPALKKTDSRYLGKDPKYRNLAKNEIPTTESLKDTVARVIPYWNKSIVPNIKQGKKVIIAASGNSLRALLKHLDSISDEDIVKVNIPTGIPLVYELDRRLMPIKHYYLGSPKEVKKAIKAIEAQGKTS